MPLAKLISDGSTTEDATKSEGPDALETFIRQAAGKEEPCVAFSRPNDNNPVQWIQLLNALDHQDLLGWPLITPLKVQMQKCDKCSREFVSPINYRRHIRMHRRSLNVDKESHKNRDLLGAFWDKISLDKAKEISSFKDVNLEEVAGSSIIKALASFILQPGFALPQIYVKAGSVLLDVIQGRPSRMPISSPELFSILDDASEKTFLCAGAAESMQKYVFDGEAGKIGLEMKNLVACTSFLFEQKLVKAWIADKDAEALRCEKLLVEEEEAAQRRQAELLEKKRLKRLRLKEQKAKEQSCQEKPVSNGTSADILESLATADVIEGPATADIIEGPANAEPSSPQPPLSEGDLLALEAMTDHVPSLVEPVNLLNNEEVALDIEEAQGGFSSSEQLDSSSPQPQKNVESQNGQGNSCKHLAISSWEVPKSRNGFIPGQNLHIVKPEPAEKHTPHKEDAKPAPIENVSKEVLTRKPIIGNGEVESMITRSQEEEEINQTEQELMFGSISVKVKIPLKQKKDIQKLYRTAQNSSSSIEHVFPKKVGTEDDKLMKTDSVESGTMPGESCLGSCEMNGDDVKSKEIMQPEGVPFCSKTARAFLAHRWEEAISGDHEILVLSPEPDVAPTDCLVPASAAKGSDIKELSVLGSTENQLNFPKQRTVT